MVRTHEIGWVGAELPDAGIKLAATHVLGNIKPKCALAIFLMLQTKLANYHVYILILTLNVLSCSHLIALASGDEREIPYTLLCLLDDVLASIIRGG